MDRTDHIVLVGNPYIDLTDQIFLVENPYMDPKSVHVWKKSPFTWTLNRSISGYFTNRGKICFSLFQSPYFIKRDGLLTGGTG